MKYVRMGGTEVLTLFWKGDLRERDHLENLDVEWRITLKYIFKKLDGGMDWIYLAQSKDRRGGSCGNEPSGSIKSGEFLR